MTVARIDVVDGAAVRLADLAVVRQVGAHGHETALLGERPLDRGHARRAAVGQRVGDGADPAAGGLGGAQQRPRVAAHGVDHETGLLPRVPDGVEHQPGRGGVPRRPPLVVAERPRLGVDVEQHLAEVHGVDAVDQRLVRLREDGHPAVGEPLDEVDLPQRTVPVERARDDPGHQLAQLVEAARARQRRAAYVEGEVEVRVVDPHRVGQAARNEPDLLAVPRDERDPVPDQLDQPLVGETGVSRLEDLDGRVVHRRGRRLLGEETQVPRPQPLAHHDALSVSVRGPIGDQSPPGLLNVGFWQRRAPDGCSSHEKEDFHDASYCRSARDPDLRGRTALRVRGRRAVERPGRHDHRDQDHRDHLHGRHRRAQRRAGRGQGRPEDRARGQGRRAGRDARPLEPRAGVRVRRRHHDLDDGPHRTSRASSTSSPTTSRRSSSSSKSR